MNLHSAQNVTLDSIQVTQSLRVECTLNILDVVVRMEGGVGLSAPISMMRGQDRLFRLDTSTASLQDSMVP